MTPHCALHPTAAAAHACRRCGNFACVACLAGTQLCLTCRELPGPNARKPSAMPTVGFVLSLLGLCLYPLLFAGGILGLISIVQKKGSQALALASVGISAAAIPIIGILAAIAIPNFLTFNVRARQAECKANLKGAYTAQKSYYAERDTYDLDPKRVGFVPEKGNRYLYLLAGAEPSASNPSFVGADTAKFPSLSNAELYAGVPPEVRASLGITGKCPDCSITMACAGNLDNDPVIDVWTISTADRPGAPAGTLFNDVNDAHD